MKHIKQLWLEILMAIDFYRAARACGLNVINSIYVAHGDVSLSEALGDMDYDAESAFMELMGLGEEDMRDDFAHMRQPRTTVVTGAPCECVGEQACDDCIPF